MLQSALPGGGFVFWVLFFVFVFGQWQLHHHFCTVGVPVDKLHAAAVGVYDLLHHMQAQNMRGVLPFRFAVQHGQHALRVAGAVILYGQVQRCFVGIHVESQRDRPRIMAHGILQHIFQRTVYLADALVRLPDGTAQPLTATERALLQKLAENRGHIVTYDAVCEAVWGADYYGYENSLNVHIRHLREKLEPNPSKPQ